jgi:guanine deaminase
VGDAANIRKLLDGSEVVVDYRGKTILPGFVDTHIHYVQTNVIASYGAQLLDWLNKFTFPEEARFADPAYAEEAAQFFINELLRNGTTSAMVFASSHKSSADAIFEEAKKRQMCLVAGKVLMDRNAPAQLCDTPESAYADSKELIKTWHGKERLRYALTPRFAPTSTEAQLEVVKSLLHEFDDLHIQTHVAENPQEVAWVAELFPWSRSYLDVYDRYDMLRERAVYAHCIYLDEHDRKRLGETGASISFCPTSNLFLGSGLFKINENQKFNVRVGIGTDVGGGTSFSILRTLHEAYKVSQMARQEFSAFDAFYTATLGGARSLYLDQEIGNFDSGKAADFVVLDTKATPLLARRMRTIETLEEKLFVLMMLGDEHMVYATHVLGKLVYSNFSI